MWHTACSSTCPSTVGPVYCHELQVGVLWHVACLCSVLLYCMPIILCLLSKGIEGEAGARKWVHDTVHCALHHLYGTRIYSCTHLQPVWCAKQVVCFTACVSLFVCLLCRGDGGVPRWVHDCSLCSASMFCYKKIIYLGSPAICEYRHFSKWHHNKFCLYVMAESLLSQLVDHCTITDHQCCHTGIALDVIVKNVRILRLQWVLIQCTITISSIVAEECHVALEIHILLLPFQWAMLVITLKLYRGVCVICWDIAAVSCSCHWSMRSKLLPIGFPKHYVKYFL